jgi:hypothetical protein
MFNIFVVVLQQYRNVLMNELSDIRENYINEVYNHI